MKNVSKHRCTLIVAAIIAVLLMQQTKAGSLVAVSPSGASAGVTISLVGTGFDATPANDRVTFTPASGAAVSVAAASVGAADPATGQRRLTVVVPGGLAVGTTALQVA